MEPERWGRSSTARVQEQGGGSRVLLVGGLASLPPPWPAVWTEEAATTEGAEDAKEPADRSRRGGRAGFVAGIRGTVSCFNIFPWELGLPETFDTLQIPQNHLFLMTSLRPDITNFTSKYTETVDFQIVCVLLEDLFEDIMWSGMICNNLPKEVATFGDGMWGKCDILRPKEPEFRPSVNSDLCRWFYEERMAEMLFKSGRKASKFTYGKNTSRHTVAEEEQMKTCKDEDFQAESTGAYLHQQRGRYGINCSSIAPAIHCAMKADPTRLMATVPTLHATGNCSFLSDFTPEHGFSLTIQTFLHDQFTGNVVDFSSIEAVIHQDIKPAPIWLMATAAPHHATGNRSFLSDFTPEHGFFVQPGYPAPMLVLGRGNVVTETMVFSDVWYVPGLAANVISASQLAELDYTVGFARGVCRIRSAADGADVGKASVGEDGLFKLDFLRLPLAAGPAAVHEA